MSFSEWREVKLEDIIEIEMGQSPKSEFYNQTGEGLPFLQGNRTFGDKYPYFDTYCTENKKIANKNDVIMSVRAPVGDLNIAQTQISLGRGVCAMRLKGEQNSNYLFYLMKHNIKEMINRESGTVFGSVNKKDILGLDVKITNNKLEQKAIAHILSTLDDKIEVNNQINKTLENMAQAIFKQWFVDFEFPNEDGEPYKSSGGEMVESELGLIPLGWKVHLLKDFVPVITGKKNANVATNSGKYKFFTCSQIASKTDDYSFEGKAILVAGNGDFNVKFYNGKFEAYQRTYVLIPHKEDLSGFIYYMMDYNLEEIVTNARGSVISYLTKGDLEDSKIAFPEKENHIQYTVIFQIINEFILNLNKENEKLSELRDTLLPKLMSGEIRVPLDSEGDVS
ncbi:restriction endonuclease subunit S [Enterococcus faecium]|uniref:restriction endonuclease subunit S n=1 Tax=Enterococcus faecium TaxID=1352 RepID=UPI0029556755|nr:restriction endonuclease subunit S [Enterococcus faecium]MDV7725522.1 restriction endonuclease subunit S [Enterococcus faecium]